MDVVTERPTAPPPYHTYATITGVFVAGLALSAATFKAARTIVRDDLTTSQIINVHNRKTWLKG